LMRSDMKMTQTPSIEWTDLICISFKKSLNILP